MGKRRPKHPEAVAKERAARVPKVKIDKGWRPDYGWLVRFYQGHEWKFTRHYPPGSDFKLVQEETRLTLKESKTLTKAWIIMKNGRRKQ